MTMTSILAAMAVAMGVAVGVAQAGEIIAGPVGNLYVDDGGTGGVPVVFIHSLAIPHIGQHSSNTCAKHGGPLPWICAGTGNPSHQLISIIPSRSGSRCDFRC